MISLDWTEIVIAAISGVGGYLIKRSSKAQEDVSDLKTRMTLAEQNLTLLVKADERIENKANSAHERIDDMFSTH